MTEADERLTPGLGPPASLAGLAIYTMFRGPEAQLVEWCNFHLTAGTERLYVVLDCPPKDLVSSLPDDPRIRWTVIEQATWDAFYPRANQNVERKQVDAFRWVARQAAADGQEHLAFVDVDELIWLAAPFADLAARWPDASAIILPVSEMWYAHGTQASHPFAATLALGPAGREHRLDIARALGWRAQFLRRGLLGHEAGKSVYRLPVAEGRITVHRPMEGVAADRSVGVPRREGRLLHFDCGDLSTWNAKWGARLAGTTTATGLAAQRLAQHQLFAHELRRSPEEQQRFFDEFYTLDAHAERLLAGDGLLEHIDVMPHMAEPLTVPAPRHDLRTGLLQLPDVHARVDFQFALVCDRRFVRPTFATMAAVLAHMGELGTVRFVVLGDGLGSADVAQLRSLEHTHHRVEVLVHDVTPDLDRDVGTEDPKRATFGRIYLIDHLPEQRTVYLDGDVLPTRPFSELFELDLAGACLAGVPDSAGLRILENPASVPIQQWNRLMGITRGDPLEYLNGGVLVFDLDNPDFRRLALQARSLVVLQGRALRQRDQDAMNMAFSGRKHRLPTIYNYMTQFYVSDRSAEGNLPQLKYAAADATLIHFSGRIKPWEEQDDDFYSGLYRRLVLETEDRLGISCGFYFSRPTSIPGRRWDVARWRDVLAAPSRSPGVAPVEDLELVDLCDDGVYLRMSTAQLELARERESRLVLTSGGRTLAQADFGTLGSPVADLAGRVGFGIRKLPLDLVGALSSHGGVARHVELLLTCPGADTAFDRTVGVVDLVASGRAATPARLQDLDVDGRLERVSNGWISGWYDARGRGPGDQVSLYIGDDLAARAVPDLERPDLEEGKVGGRRPVGFRFRLADLVRRGYGAGGGEVSVRVARTNVPLAGSPLPTSSASRELAFDPASGAWVPRRRGRPSPTSWVRNRARRVVRR
jgi:lipopolysaccharide biosynthesis glycosyltransferase